MKFKSHKQLVKCAKAWALLIIYHNPTCDDASEDVEKAMFEYAERELFKMNMPDGWQRYSDYLSFKAWFIEKC